MKVRRLDNADAFALSRIVERLSTHDRCRIVRLIDLLVRAPIDLRRRAQSRLRDVVEANPDSHEDCAAAIDTIIEHTEREIQSCQIGALRDSWTLASREPGIKLI